MKMANLTAIRRELVLAKVPKDKDFDTPALKSAMIRLFPDLGKQEARQQNQPHRPQHRRPLQHSQHTQHQKRGFRSTHETQLDDEEDDGGYPDEEDYSDEFDPTYLQEAARHELEALSADIEHAGEEAGDQFTEEQAVELEQATATLAATSEALETIRNARNTLTGQDPAVKGRKGQRTRRQRRQRQGQGRQELCWKSLQNSGRAQTQLRVQGLPSAWPLGWRPGMPRSTARSLDT
jgi:hypothetical protein